MNIMSVVIILIVLFYVVLGFKRGVIKTGVSLIGSVAILVVSYVLKDIVANFLMDKFLLHLLKSNSYSIHHLS